MQWSRPVVWCVCLWRCVVSKLHSLTRPRFVKSFIVSFHYTLPPIPHSISSHSTLHLIPFHTPSHPIPHSISSHSTLHLIPFHTPSHRIPHSISSHSTLHLIPFHTPSHPIPHSISSHSTLHPILFHKTPSFFIPHLFPLSPSSPFLS